MPTIYSLLSRFIIRPQSRRARVSVCAHSFMYACIHACMQQQQRVDKEALLSWEHKREAHTHAQSKRHSSARLRNKYEFLIKFFSAAFVATAAVARVLIIYCSLPCVVTYLLTAEHLSFPRSCYAFSNPGILRTFDIEVEINSLRIGLTLYRKSFQLKFAS